MDEEKYDDEEDEDEEDDEEGKRWVGSSEQAQPSISQTLTAPSSEHRREGRNGRNSQCPLKGQRDAKTTKRGRGW